MAESPQAFHRHISADKGAVFPFAEVLGYKDLIRLYTRKNIVVTYRQTVLGPLWLILSPLLQSVVMLFVFGYLAGFQTGNVPKIVFYLFSTTAWQLFNRIANNDSRIFATNERLFGKVAFPRLAISYAGMFSTAYTSVFPLLTGCCFLAYYAFTGQMAVAWTLPLAVLPLIQLAIAGQGLGLIFGAVVVRYRDMSHLFPLLLNVLMYLSPVVYPLSQFGNSTLRLIASLNPLCAPLEMLRACLWGAPWPPLWNIVYSVVLVFGLNLLGVFMFTRAEKNFIDTI